MEDLTTLAHLDEDVLLQELKVRYSENNVYVSNSFTSVICWCLLCHIVSEIRNDTGMTTRATVIVKENVLYKQCLI